MDDVTRRKIFQRVRNMTLDQYWAFTNWALTRAYEIGVQHVREAMECHPRLYPKLIGEVMAKAEQIREEWDGITTVWVPEDEDRKMVEVVKGRKGV